MQKFEELKQLIDKIKKQESLVPLLSDFLDWFVEKLNIEFFNKNNSIVPKKWDIFYVNLWKNIGSELNKIRPCIVVSKRKFNAWWTVLIAPLRSYKWKDKKYFIKIEPDDINNLWKVSLVDIFAIRQVDKKRLKQKIWKLSGENLYNVDTVLLKIFWIKNSGD